MRLTSSWIIVIGFATRVLVAFCNGFFGSSIGADKDAFGFHIAASNVAMSGVYESFNIGTAPYINFLGFIYHLINAHLFLGSLASCVAWLFSAYLLRKTLLISLASFSDIRKAMLIYAFLPSSIFFTSITLREVYQLLFINLAIYSIFKIHSKKNNLYTLPLIFSLICAGILHGALLAFSIVVLLVALFFLFFPKFKRISVVNILFIGLFACFFLIIGFRYFSAFTYSLDGGLDNSVAAFREGGLGEEARARYAEQSVNTGFSFLFVSIPVSVFQYFFEPLPGRGIGLLDLPVVFENILRAFLIYKAYLKISERVGRDKYLFCLIGSFYILLELIWSLGTINWGTAVRHHLPATGLLLLCAYSFPFRNYFYNSSLPAGRVMVPNRAKVLAGKSS